MQNAYPVLVTDISLSFPVYNNERKQERLKVKIIVQGNNLLDVFKIENCACT